MSDQRSLIAVRLLRVEIDQTCDADPTGGPCMECGKASIMHGFKKLLARTWQSIETAPKDGTPLLLWWTTRGASSGAYSFDEDRNECGWKGDQDLVIPRDQRHCTHWMPLPSPPVTDPAPSKVEG